MPSSVSTRPRRAIAQPRDDLAIEAYNLRKVYRTRKGPRAAVE